MRSGGVCSVEQRCAAIMGAVTIAAWIAYKRGRSCTGGMTNNEIDSNVDRRSERVIITS
jgi:hypothetical protein